MFDYHMHSTVSFDGNDSALDMALAAKAAGLKEICFTDHIDYTPQMNMVFDTNVYNEAYDRLEVPGLLIRRGMEFGLTPTNRAQLETDSKRCSFDFIIGSVHLVDDKDIYLDEYWEGKTMEQAVDLFLQETLACVRVHDGYDVLGHLTYLSKSPANPARKLLSYEDHREILDEILREMVRHNKGIEVNTSGIDRCGGPLPTMDFVRRFKELGGRIVTVGSDAHDVSRVGQYTRRMAEQVKEIFGYVCTFENRQPVFHK